MKKIVFNTFGFRFKNSLFIVLLAFFSFSCGDDDDAVTKSSAKEITAFSFETSKNSALADSNLKDKDLKGVIDESKKTVKFSLTVSRGLKDALEAALKSLKATFTVSDKATVKVDNTEQKSGETEQDFSKEVKYTVTAEDGTKNDYTVTIEVNANSAQSSEKKITAFSFESSKNSALVTAQLGDVKGVIDESQKTIKFSLALPSGVDKATVEAALKSLKATFTVSAKATVKVVGIEQKTGETANDFSQAVTYTVTAEDETIQTYVVTIEILTSFTDERDGKEYPIAQLGDKIWMLKNFEYESKNSVVAKNGTQTFGRAYTQEDAREQAPPGWRLPTIEEWEDLRKKYGNDLLAGGNTQFNVVNGPLGSCGTDSCSRGDMHFWTHADCFGMVIAEDNPPPQNTSCSGMLFLVRYVKGDEKLLRTGKKLLDLKFEKANNPSLQKDVKQARNSDDLVIDNETIIAHFPAGTDINPLIPTFSISKLAQLTINGQVVESGKTKVDFSSKKLNLVVTAENGDKNTYEMTVIVGKSPLKSLNIFVLGIKGQFFTSATGKIDQKNKTVTATVSKGTNVKELWVSAGLSPKAKLKLGDKEVNYSPFSPYDFTNPVTFTVVAEDGTTQDYVVTVTVKK